MAFIAGGSVMILELLAFRLIARHLGSSNYTVTAIIGVVLGGLAAGNFLGGYLADRFRLGRLLSLLFVLSSAACFAVPVVNHLVGEWTALFYLSWPKRIAAHVTLTFLVPSVVLGTIGPVVAKMALLRSIHVGRTVGSVYALGALGSIVGTFACGFLLIPNFGNHAVIQCLGGLLAGMAIVSGTREWLPYGWGGAAIVLMAIGLAPWPWARTVGADWGMRESITPLVLFDADSEYGHVRVEQSHEVPGLRLMILDKLDHSYVNLHRPEDLLYSYERVYSAITDHVAGSRDAVRALILGGGGYTHPRHILRRRPHSFVEVAEIDPVVTEAAMVAFGLTPDPRMKIVHLDARQHLADLLRRKPVPRFDFVFLDAVNDFNVPFHLTTLECQRMIDSLLTPDGVFLMTLIDVMEVGGFLGSTLKTLRETFPYCECFCAGVRGGVLNPSGRYTFVIASSKKDWQLNRLALAADLEALRLTDEQKNDLIGRPEAIVLTDDHAPVEHLLLGVVQRMGQGRAVHEAAMKYHQRGNALASLGRPAEAIEAYQKALELEPSHYDAHMGIGLAAKELRRFDEAIAAFETASRLRPEMPSPVINLGGIHMLRHDYASAVAAYERAVTIDSSYAPSHNALGMALANLGRLDDARAAFRKALELNSSYEEARSNLARVEAAMKGSPASAPSSPMP